MRRGGPAEGTRGSPRARGGRGGRRHRRRPGVLRAGGLDGGRRQRRMHHPAAHGAPTPAVVAPRHGPAVPLHGAGACRGRGAHGHRGFPHGGGRTPRCRAPRTGPDDQPHSVVRARCGVDGCRPVRGGGIPRVRSCGPRAAAGRGHHHGPHPGNRLLREGGVPPGVRRAGNPGMAGRGSRSPGPSGRADLARGAARRGGCPGVPAGRAPLHGGALRRHGGHPGAGARGAARRAVDSAGAGAGHPHSGGGGGGGRGRRTVLTVLGR